MAAPVVLAHLDDPDIEWLASVGWKLRLADGTVLIEEGGPISAISIVLEGGLHVTNAAHNLDVHLGVGELVGEMSFVDSSMPSATVRCEGSTVVLNVPRERLSQRLAANEGFAARFYRALTVLLADRLRHMLRPDEVSPPSADAQARAALALERLR